MAKKEDFSKFKLKPVRKLFSKKVRYTEGIPEGTLNIAHELGLLSNNEYKVIMGIKESKAIDLPDMELLSILQELFKKGVLMDV